MKKTVVAVVVVVTVLASVFLLSAESVLADEVGGTGGGSGGSSTTHGNCPGDDVNFLSFPTWYRGLECDASGSINIGEGTDPSKTVFTIALNVLDIMLRLAGVLAVGFVVFGGFQYMTPVASQKTPRKAATPSSRH
jgi:hypothetical protein